MRDRSALHATVQRILATRLNWTIVAGMVLLLHRGRTVRLIPCRALHFFHAKDFLALVYETVHRRVMRLLTCGCASLARLAPEVYFVTLLRWRRRSAALGGLCAPMSNSTETGSLACPDILPLSGSGKTTAGSKSTKADVSLQARSQAGVYSYPL
jgi:hypothetical protein